MAFFATKNVFAKISKKWLSGTRDFLDFGNFENFEKNYYCCKLIFIPDFWLFPKALPWPNFFRSLKKHGKSFRPRKSQVEYHVPERLGVWEPNWPGTRNNGHPPLFVRSSLRARRAPSCLQPSSRRKIPSKNSSVQLRTTAWGDKGQTPFFKDIFGLKYGTIFCKKAMCRRYKVR